MTTKSLITLTAGQQQEQRQLGGQQQQRQGRRLGQQQQQLKPRPCQPLRLKELWFERRRENRKPHPEFCPKIQQKIRLRPFPFPVPNRGSRAATIRPSFSPGANVLKLFLSVIYGFLY